MEDIDIGGQNMYQINPQVQNINEINPQFQNINQVNPQMQVNQTSNFVWTEENKREYESKRELLQQISEQSAKMAKTAI